jgi:hypothetical protein
MARTWVLDSETKGIGAHMAPLGRSDDRPSDDRALATVKLAREPGHAAPPAPRERQRFKVVDVLSGRVLADNVGAREAIDALAGLRSVLDARVSVWSVGARRWKLLSLAEQKQLWRFRGRPSPR